MTESTSDLPMARRLPHNDVSCDTRRDSWQQKHDRHNRKILNHQPPRLSARVRYRFLVHLKVLQPLQWKTAIRDCHKKLGKMATEGNPTKKEKRTDDNLRNRCPKRFANS
jgi:hypothetical protein